MDGPAKSGSWALTFVEPGLVGFGSTPAVRTSLDLKSGGESVKTNGELMNLVRSFDDGNAWAVGRFDTVAQGRVPDRLSTQLPPISWLSVGGHIDTGIRGIVRADTKDADSANNLREAARGFIALARLQMSTQPEMRQLVDSLNLGGTGTAVTLSFDVPPDAVGALKSYQPPLPLPGK
jgi:hypothetical protein